MESIFSTKERIKILKAVIFKKSAVSVNNVADQLKLSKGLVSKYFDILVKMGIAKKLNGKLGISDSSLVRGIRILFNIKNINAGMFKKYPFVRSAALYGSCAKGENTEGSDVDLWLRVSDVSEDKHASLSSELRKRIKNIKPLFLTDEKIGKIKKEDVLFFHSLFFGSIRLYGGKDDIWLQ